MQPDHLRSDIPAPGGCRQRPSDSEYRGLSQPTIALVYAGRPKTRGLRLESVLAPQSCSTGAKHSFSMSGVLVTGQGESQAPAAHLRVRNLSFVWIFFTVFTELSQHQLQRPQQLVVPMPFLFPSVSALSATFGSHVPVKDFRSEPAKRSPYTVQEGLYQSWSVAGDAQGKGSELSDAATKEIQKASSAAQAKAGKIELFSPSYYAA